MTNTTYFAKTQVGTRTRMKSATIHVLLGILLSSQTACDNEESRDGSLQQREAIPNDEAPDESELVLGDIHLEGNSIVFAFKGPNLEPKASWRGAEAAVELDDATQMWIGSLRVGHMLTTLGQGTAEGLHDGRRRAVLLQLGEPPDDRDVEAWLLVRNGTVEAMWSDEYLNLQADLAAQAGVVPSDIADSLPADVPLDGASIRIAGVIQGSEVD